MTTTTHQQLQELALLRIWQIVGNSKTNTPALIPIGRTSFLNGVKSGIYPQPVRLGGPNARTVAWRSIDIKNLIEKLGA
ncbi:MAG: AlpA family transcriptional regulator [Methylobacter sp.]|nr:AlpA family transcriptional regulator [Methylobacter sp.]